MSRDFQETDNMRTTQRRDDAAPIRVTREVPLHWLLGIVGTIAASLVNSYFVQQEQTRQLAKLGVQVEKIGETLTRGDQKSQEHSFKLLDLERRMSAVELRGEKK